MVQSLSAIIVFLFNVIQFERNIRQYENSNLTLVEQ